MKQLDYQFKAVKNLKEKSNELLDLQGNHTIVFKAPTGSGKTIMMAEFLKEFFGVDEFTDGETRYAIDRQGYRNGQHCINVEVEIKQHWKNGHKPFPFEDIKEISGELRRIAQCW